MKNLSRKDVIAKFDEIVAKFGKPECGDIFCKNQLIAKIVKCLCAFDNAHITYQYGAFEVSSLITMKNMYPNDYIFIGTVNAKEWFTAEQLRALHELGFGYQF